MSFMSLFRPSKRESVSISIEARETEFDTDTRFVGVVNGVDVGRLTVRQEIVGYSIWSVHVKKLHRGRGIAKQLIQYVMDKYDDSPIYLFAAAEREEKGMPQKKLVAFYEGFGFVVKTEELGGSFVRMEYKPRRKTATC